MISFVATLSCLFLLSFFYFDKDNGFDKDKMPVLRAFMALVIILGHICTKVDISWLQQFRFWGAPFVSVFFFISGYGMASSKTLSFREFVAKRILKILVPYLVTVFLYYVLVRIPDKDYVFHIRETITSGTSRQHHLWFVFAILAQYIAFFYCWKFKDNHKRLCSLFATCFLLCVLLWGVGYGRHWYVSLLAFPMGASFSVLRDTVKKRCFRNGVSYLISFALIMILAALFYGIGVELLYSISHIFIAFAVGLVVSQLPLAKLNNGVVLFFGSISYEMYLCQVISMDFLRGSICFIEPDLLYVILSILMTTGLAAIVHWLCAKNIVNNG